MSHLPPPPPNAAPYAPPPSHGGQQYPYPYQGQPPYQPPPPAAGYGSPPYQQNGYGQDSSPPRAGPPGPPKSKMQVTRYPPPPGHPSRQYSGGQPPYVPPPHQPPPAAPYPQTNWAPPPQQPYGQPPANYPLPPPPQAAGHYPPPHQAPPPPQQPPYAGYSQPPPTYAPPYPPPPPQPNAYGHYPPPPNQPIQPWATPQSQHHAQPAWSPPPTATSQHGPPGPPGPPTPIQSVISSGPPVAPYSVGPEVIKDRSDPTFYDGWDEHEFEWGQALWPKSNEPIDDRFSLGQYIWHPAERLSCAISSDIDVPLLPVPTAQRHDSAEPDLVVSKYFQPGENEGDEYVYNFQRIRYIEEEWAERKDDPLFRQFSPEDIHKYLDVNQIKEQVLEDAKQLRKSQSKVDVMGSLEQALSTYIPTSKAPSAPESATGAPDGKASRNDATEALLASLGVSGEAKPVYTTPFPAYAPSVEDPIFSPARRTSSTHPTYNPPYNPPAPQHPNLNLPPPSAHRATPPQPPPSYHSNQPPPMGQYPNRPPPHMSYGNHPPPPPPPTSGYRASSPPHSRQRSASIDSYADPWKTNYGGNGREGTPSVNGPGTPVGSDFGDLHPNGSGSENTLKADTVSPPPKQFADQSDSKKRKTEDHDGVQRKKSKGRIQVDAAYQRRW